MFDALIIGAGVVGSAIADRLALAGYKVLLLEKEDDVASGASRANSGIVHAGYDCTPNSLKAKFNTEGCPMFGRLTDELDVPYKNTGSLVVASKNGREGISRLYERGKKNGVNVEIIGRDKILELEPNVTDDIELALYAKDAGVVSPYKLTVAFADRAVLNGAKVVLECKINSIEKEKGQFKVKTDKGVFGALVLINSAGAFADQVNLAVGAEEVKPDFVRGDYFVLDSTEGGRIKTVLFPLPDERGKGILVAPTSDGNVIYGPTSIASLRGDGSVTAEGLELIRNGVKKIYKAPDYRKVIRLYSGLRTICGNDFVVEKSSKVQNYIYLAGICSPGLTSAPAIAVYVNNLVEELIGARTPLKNPVIRLKHKRLTDLSVDEINGLVKDDPRWGTIVCRCEKVTEAEVVAAIHSPVPATTVDAVKRRVRAGMGRCQGSFCGPRVMEILSRELNIPMTKVRKGGEGSEIAPYRVNGEDGQL